MSSDSLQEFRLKVLSMVRSPGNGNIACTVPDSSKLPTPVCPSARLSNNRENSESLEVCCGPRTIVYPVVRDLPRIPDLLTPLKCYYATGRFNLPNNLSTYVPKPTESSDRNDAVETERRFLSHVYRSYGEFALFNPSILACTFAFDHFKSVSVILTPDSHDYILPVLKNLQIVKSRDFTVNGKVTIPVYHGSNGRVGDPNSLWFALQVSPYSESVISRYSDDVSVKYIYRRGTREISANFDFTVGYYRTSLEALKGFHCAPGYFLISNMKWDEVDNIGCNFISQTAFEGKVDNSNLASVFSDGKNIVNIEGNLILKSKNEDLCYGKVYLRNHGPDNSFVNKLTSGIVAFSEYLVKVRLFLINGHICYEEGLPATGLFHLFYANGDHREKIFDLKFGTLLMHRRIDTQMYRFCSGDHQLRLTEPALKNMFSARDIGTLCEQGYLLFGATIVPPTHFPNYKVYDRLGRPLSVASIVSSSIQGEVNFVGPKAGYLAKILRRSGHVVQSVKTRDGTVFHSFWNGLSPGSVHFLDPHYLEDFVLGDVRYSSIHSAVESGHSLRHVLKAKLLSRLRQDWDLPGLIATEDYLLDLYAVVQELVGVG